MKKGLLAVLTLTILLAISLAAFGCDKKSDADEARHSIQYNTVYGYAKEAGFTGSMEDLQEFLKGDSAYTLAVEKGYQGSEEEWLETLKGAAGRDGVTPHIGANNHWFIGETDTGVLAEGVKGDKGDNGRGIKRAYVNDEGYIVVVYTDDQEEVLDQVVQPHPHEIAEKIIVECEASCTAEGKTLLICETCGELLKTIVTPRLTHDDEISLVPPTCTEQGYTARTCKLCGRVERSDFTNATGHAYLEGYEYDADRHWHPASCGHTDTVRKEDHTLVGGVCSVCGFEVADLTLLFEKIDDKEEYAVIGYKGEPTSASIPLTYRNLPVTEIGDGAFANCLSLSSIAIPNSVNHIACGAFSGCNGLTEITLPFVGENADGSGSSLFSWIFGGTHFLDTSSRVPRSLETVTLTGGSAINSYAFYACTRLRNINIPDTVESINPYAFTWCGFSSITIPDSVRFIGNFAFGTCSNLTSVKIPPLVETLESYVFYNCENLRTVTFDKEPSLTTIDSNAFFGCTSLSSIVLPETVIAIRRDAFTFCSSLLSVIIDYNSDLSIQENAFSYCYSLISIVFKGTRAQWNTISKDSGWNNNMASCIVYCTDQKIY